MYDYIKNALQNQSLRHAVIDRTATIIFVIDTNKDSVIEVVLTYKDYDWVLLAADISARNFAKVLENYFDAFLFGCHQSINVYHSENVVQLKSE